MLTRDLLTADVLVMFDDQAVVCEYSDVNLPDAVGGGAKISCRAWVRAAPAKERDAPSSRFGQTSGPIKTGSRLRVWILPAELKNAAGTLIAPVQGASLSVPGFVAGLAKSTAVLSLGKAKNRDGAIWEMDAAV